MARRISVALLVCMVLTLVAGCGGSKGDIVIGHYAPMSGDTAAWGQMEIKGVQLAEEEINKAGGILGRKIKIISYDDRGDKVEAVNVVKKLISEKAVGIVGEQTSSACMAAGPIVAAAKIPAIGTASTNPRVTVGDDGKLNPFYFRVCFIDPFQGRALAFYAKKLNKMKAAILYDIGEDYAVGLADAFKKNYTELGGTIVAVETFKGGEEDFRAQLTRIKQFNPEVICIPIYYKEAALAMRQARELGMDAMFMGGDGLESTTLIELAGEAAEGCVFTSHYSSEDTTPATKKFIESFKAKFKGEEPDVNSALGYDGVKIMADAIKRAGKDDPQAIRDALEQTKGLECATGTITIDPKTHDPLDKSIVVNVVKNGKIQFLERLDLAKVK